MATTFEVDLTRNIDTETDLAEIVSGENTFNKKYPAITLGTLIMLNGIPVMAAPNSIENFRLRTHSDIEISTLINNYSDIINQSENVCDYNLLTPTREIFQQVSSIESLRKDLSRNVLAFKTLIANWDGYGAIPLSVECALNAITFINLVTNPTILSSIEDYYPNPNGTVTFVWENESNIVQAEFGERTVNYFVVNGDKKYFFNDVEVTLNEITKLALFIESI